MRRLLITIFAITTSLCAWASSQNEIVLNQARFHKGDAPQGWMSVDFDDSSWEIIAIPDKWHGEGLYAQYRVKFDVPEGFISKAPYKQYAICDLAYIDDCDEAYLNGVQIGKSGVMPHEGMGYSAWDTHRVYQIDSDILKEGENILTVLVWNRRTRGGVYGGPFKIRMARLEDLLSFSFSGDGDAANCRLTVTTDVRVKGKLVVESTKKFDKTVNLSTKQPYIYDMTYDGSEPIQFTASFTDNSTGQSVRAVYVPKYCLTPDAPLFPRYNGPAVFGARPGSPVIYRLPFSGKKPMSFKVHNLPEGLSFDAENGIVSGSVSEVGDYDVEFEAFNEEGTGKGRIKIKIGETFALTPPMGWNSWNCWGLDLTQEKVFSSALALINSGLADYGYSYINIDDAWQASQRTEDGVLMPNDNFPDVKSIGDWLHSRGLRLGIYSSPGDLTCGGYLGSLGYEKKDAETWNEWGVDYLKYDLCGYRSILDTMSFVLPADHIRPYLKMQEYLREQPRDICYSLCQYGLADVWKWGALIGANLWRTTGDITDTWESVTRIGFNLQRNLSSYAGPGHWNDPDMLVVGKVGWGKGLRDSRLTADEQYSHVSLWSLLSSPLLIGCDLATLDRFTRNLLCNNEIIAVNQDALGRQSDCLYDCNGIQVWGKELSDGSYAAGIFNHGDEVVIVDVADILSKAGWKSVGTCRDLWRQKECPGSVEVPIHGVIMLKFNAAK